uniref:BTB domain-containing protein n=1 Tax=Panagrellus redivivus TaxID=6233 RepID=A0A7E4V3M8_PANRE
MVTKQLKLEFQISTSELHEGGGEYFNYAERLNDATNSMFTLKMYNEGLPIPEDVVVTVKFTGGSYYVSGILRSDSYKLMGNGGNEAQKTMCNPGCQVFIFCENSDFLFRDRSYTTITIDLTLEPILDKTKFMLPCPTTFELATDSNQPPIFDVAFIVGGNKLPANRGFLSMMSPVFRAMFAHNTQDDEKGTIEITDFDFYTVSNVMNFCYGMDTGARSVVEVIQMLLFADKYDIQTVIKRCDEALCTHITSENFCHIADYVWTMNRSELKPVCVEFFRQNHPKITLTPSFAGLPFFVREGIIQEAVLVE